MLHINIFLIFPAIVVACVLVQLAFADFRGFLLFGAFVAVLCGIGWLVCLFAPVIFSLLVGVMLFFGIVGNSGGDLLDAFCVHSVVPSVSTGEACAAKEAGLF